MATPFLEFKTVQRFFFFFLAKQEEIGKKHMTQVEHMMYFQLESTHFTHICSGLKLILVKRLDLREKILSGTKSTFVASH